MVALGCVEHFQEPCPFSPNRGPCFFELGRCVRLSCFCLFKWGCCERLGCFLKCVSACCDALGALLVPYEFHQALTKRVPFNKLPPVLGFINEPPPA